MKAKFTLTRILKLFILVLCFCIFTFTNAQTDNEQGLVYVKIEIMGLACPFCAFGMEKELKKIAGVDNVEIELKAGLAYISTLIYRKPAKESLEKIITDAGFTVGKIEYSSKPFTIKESEE